MQFQAPGDAYPIYGSKLVRSFRICECKEVHKGFVAKGEE